MKITATKQPLWFGLAGLGVGLVFAVGLLLGSLATQRLAWQQSQGHAEAIVAETLLHATASHGNDAMAMATGLIDDGVEGCFFLDYLTGELRCLVIDRRTGAVAGNFKYNVVQDLGVEQGKSPRYLMVTGLASPLRGASAVRFAETAVYVCDANTGRFAVYMLPWNPGATANRQAQVGGLIRIQVGSVRNVAIRGGQ